MNVIRFVAALPGGVMAFKRDVTVLRSYASLREGPDREGDVAMQIAANEGGEGVRSVHRALDLLQLFDEEHSSRSARELIDATGLAKSTVVRLAATLEQRGMLWTRSDGRLTPGAGLLRWGALAQSAWQLPPEAIESLAELSVDSQGESARIYVRQGDVRVCIAQHEGTQQLRHVVRIGEAMPLWAGAAGHILLAGLVPHDQARMAHAAGLEDEYVADLNEKLRLAKDNGWSISHGEREAGVSAVAAAITDTEGATVAAVGLGGPSTRFTEERIAIFIPVLMKAASRLSGIPLYGASA